MASRVYRNKKIGEFIRSGEVACCITGSTYAVVNHHLIGHGYSAMGSKAPDFLQMAMTHDLHQELHQHGWRAFEEKYGICQKVMTTETLLALHANGIIDTNELDLPDWFNELKDFFND
ncbi:putative protein of unknown function DUF968 [Vibrio phage 242E40-1]|nr:putative protein of unknown function DUF968 [Vibrio phage 242E40-1]